MSFDLIRNNPDLLENLLEDFKNSIPSSYNTLYVMKTDIKEYKDHYVVICETPGAKKENVKISLEEGWLVVEIHPYENPDSKEKEIKEQFKYLKQERLKGIIRRSFNLGEEFNIKDIQGNLENGLLTIQINKKPQKIKAKEYLELK